MVPKLRFKNDTGREFPTWKKKKLGEICSITTGKLDANAMVKGGKYRFYTCAKDYYHTNIYAFDTEALLIAGNGNVGHIHHYKGKFNAYQRTYVIDDFTDDIKYIKYYLETNLSKRISAHLQVGSMPFIRLNTLSDMIIKCPSIAEQQKIADFLSTVDEKITCQQEQIDTLEKLKKGYMQKIFTREIRFKDDDGKEYPDWEEKKLGEIADIKKGQQVNGNELSSKGKYYLLNGGINPSGYYDRYNTEKDTISISEGGNSCGYVNYNKKRFWSGGHNYTINITGNINSYYLYSYLKYKENNIMNLRVGSGLPNIQKKDVLIYPVVLPIPSEQQKIANFLLTFDEKIDIAKEKLEHWENIKKGLLQQMFI